VQWGQPQAAGRGKRERKGKKGGKKEEEEPFNTPHRPNCLRGYIEKKRMNKQK